MHNTAKFEYTEELIEECLSECLDNKVYESFDDANYSISTLHISSYTKRNLF